MSGCSKVVAMFSGNLSCLPRSTLICQARAEARSPTDELGLCCAFSPVLMKVMDLLGTCCFLLSWIVVQMITLLMTSGLGDGASNIILPHLLQRATDDVLQGTPFSGRVGMPVCLL